MKRRWWLAALVLASTVLACRGIVGIDDLELEEAGTATKDSSVTDSGAKDVTVADSSQPTCASQGSSCIQCCHDASPGSNPGIDQLVGGCACGAAGSGVCFSQCNGTLCVTPPTSPSQPSAQCQQCIDQNLGKSGACHSVAVACQDALLV